MEGPLRTRARETVAHQLDTAYDIVYFGQISLGLLRQATPQQVSALGVGDPATVLADAQRVDANWSNHLFGLCAQSFLAAHAAVECFVEDLCVAVLLEQGWPEKDGKPDFENLKVPGHLALCGDREALALAVVKAAPRKSDSKVEHEGILTSFGLGGNVPQALKEVLLEGSAMRNLLTHRGGIIDEHYMTRFGHGKMTAGQRLPLDFAKTTDYIRQYREYTDLVNKRCADKFDTTADATTA